MHINNTRCSIFLDCRRRFYWEYLYGGHGIRGSGNSKLIFGVAMHEGLAMYYRGQPRDKILEAFRLAYAREIGPYPELAIETGAQDLEMGQRLLTSYMQRDYVTDDFEPEGEPEREFCVPLGEVCYKCGEPYSRDLDHYNCLECGADIHRLVGRVDLPVARGGGVSIMDHKTANNAGKNYLESWYHDFGMIGYAYGYGKTLNMKIQSYGLNIIVKLKTVGTEREDYKNCPLCKNGVKKKVGCSECNGAGKVEKKEQDKPKAFYREWIRIAPSDFDRLVVNRLRIIQDIEQEKELLQTEPEIAFPMSDTECHRYGPCPFLKLCWGKDVSNWHELDEVEEFDFERKGPDYVSEMAKEEMV